MKRKPGLWLRREEPTEETIFAEYAEFLSSLSCSPINCTIKDAVLVAKGFFGPAVRRYLSRAKLEDSNLGKPSRQRVQEAEQRKRHALVIAGELLRNQKVLRLPRKKSELSRRVWKELAKNGSKPPPQRTIRRYEMIPPKK